MAMVLDNGTREVRKPCVAVVHDWCSSMGSQASGGEIADNELKTSISDGDGEEESYVDDSCQATNADHGTSERWRGADV